ncbi:MAG: cytochrome ubiquinol oxidase subunit I [Acidimicrobiia bacterium]
MYPVWEGVGVHSAMFVAIIAAFHVVASHLTVGAAWFNVYIERRAVREQRPELYEYLKRSARGLLVFAYVFGAMAGVGIWQSTTAASPRGISTLIHNFVLFWGSEWYMFMIDVVGIVSYYYTFGRVEPRTHLRMAWLLALGGTGTLSLIVGILGFKLTPGQWLESGEPLDGFYNPTFWPQYLLRFLLMQTVTAVFALTVAAGMSKDSPDRERIMRWAGIFGLAGMAAGLAVTRFWYYPNLPEHARTVLRSVALPPITLQVVYGGLIVTALALLYAAWRPRLQTRIGSLALFMVLFAAIFGAERTRETMRKPDVINGYMASNNLVFVEHRARGVPSEEQQLARDGVLGNLPFVASADTLTAAARARGTDPQVEMGRVLVLQQCSACHSVSSQTAIEVAGHRLALRSQAELLIKRNMTSATDIAPYLTQLGQLPYMHAVIGTPEEIDAIAAYLEHEIDAVQGPGTEEVAGGGTDGGR